MRSSIPGLFCVCLILAACGGGGGGQGPVTPMPTPTPEPTELGDPLAGLSPAEFASFERGRSLFEKRFRPSEGLGPFYNATACASCHEIPITGGSAPLYRNFYLAAWGPSTVLEPLPPFLGAVVASFGTGGDHETATFSLEGGRMVIPETFQGWPVISAQRNALPVFGTGLLEAVSEAEILSRADPEDANGDGISGRANYDFGTIGRLGVKAQSSDIERFTRGPLMNQMGVTTNPLGGIQALRVEGDGGPVKQISTDPTRPTIDHDGVADPEMSTSDLRDLVTFTRNLAPPIPRPFDAAATRGEALFASIRCTACHVPSLPSARGPVNAYTDLLLHDLGEDLADGFTFGQPQPSTLSGPTTAREWRTQPLWGVSLHAPYLHDGRARTLREAIELHGGEAAAIRDAFLALTPAEQADLLTFLEHL